MLRPPIVGHLIYELETRVRFIGCWYKEIHMVDKEHSVRVRERKMWPHDLIDGYGLVLPSHQSPKLGS